MMYRPNVLIPEIFCNLAMIFFWKISKFPPCQLDLLRLMLQRILVRRMEKHWKFFEIPLASIVKLHSVSSEN